MVYKPSHLSILIYSRPGLIVISWYTNQVIHPYIKGETNVYLRVHSRLWTVSFYIWVYSHPWTYPRLMSTYVFTLHVQHNLALVLGTNYLILSYPWTSRHTRPNTYFLIFPPSASSKNMMLADVYLSIKSYVPRPNISPASPSRPPFNRRVTYLFLLSSTSLALIYTIWLSCQHFYL